MKNSNSNKVATPVGVVCLSTWLTGTWNRRDIDSWSQQSAIHRTHRPSDQLDFRLTAPTPRCSPVIIAKVRSPGRAGELFDSIGTRISIQSYVSNSMCQWHSWDTMPSEALSHCTMISGAWCWVWSFTHSLSQSFSHWVIESFRYSFIQPVSQ